LEKIRNTLTVVGGKDEFDLPLDEYTDKSTLFMLCEIVREKALILLDEEIPHGIAVVVSKFEEKEDIFEIEVEIFCEKDSHKNIIIGKNGSMAKEIGISARKDMEQLLGKKVMLQIWVRTKKNWRDNPSVLNDIGYNLKIDV
ncbi:MAG: KH domain-containing protein, partial [Clostridia bacterium]